MELYKPCRYIDEVTLKVVVCNRSDDCAGHVWYDPIEIRYCPHQVCWIISEFLEYSAGNIVIGRYTWPSDIRETGYTDVPGTTIGHHASYELVVQMAGEIVGRLERTGKDGQLLVLEVTKDMVFLSEEAQHALDYCSGRRSKKRSYTQWLADKAYKSDKKYRQKAKTP